MTLTTSPPARGAQLDDGPVALLAVHWRLAIDTAEAAVTASLRAELLPGDYCREELEHLRAESRWLEHAALR